jgi:hypothetical protein
MKPQEEYQNSIQKKTAPEEKGHRRMASIPLKERKKENEKNPDRCRHAE